MNRIVRSLVFSITLDGRLRARLYRSGLGLLAALCLLILPTSANAACASFGAAALTPAIKLPMDAQAAAGFTLPFEAGNPTIVGLWHVIYTNSADQST